MQKSLVRHGGHFIYHSPLYYTHIYIYIYVQRTSNKQSDAMLFTILTCSTHVLCYSADGTYSSRYNGIKYAMSQWYYLWLVPLSKSVISYFRTILEIVIAVLHSLFVTNILVIAHVITFKDVNISIYYTKRDKQYTSHSC